MDKLDTALLIDGYRLMCRIRLTEEVLAEHYVANNIYSFVHFAIGQESGAVAVGLCLDVDDRVLGNHRSHGHFLARGGSARQMMAEMLGKASGVSGGKGGSMHLVDLANGYWGSTPILSSASPIAAGYALEQKLRSKNSLSCVFVGDGASEEGPFYETLNFSAVQQLPLLIIVENNLYSVNTPKNVRRHPDFAYSRLAESLGVIYRFADGTDFPSTLEVVRSSVTDIRSGRGPVLVEVQAHRHLGHSSGRLDDHLGYRVEDTPEIRLERDPLRRLRTLIEELGYGDRLLDIEEAEHASAAAALSAALRDPEPDADRMWSNVYVD